MQEESDLKDKKEYELSVMMAEETVAGEVEAIIRKHGGELSNPARVSSVRLSYPLKKHENAFWGVFIFTALPGAVKAMQEGLGHNAKVLRSLVLTPPVKVPPKHEKPLVQKESTPTEAVAKPEAAMSNEALEKKLEEILK